MEEDVKVVQFFLTRLFSLPGFATRKPWGEMTIDGKVGPITSAWITRSQMVCRQDGVNVMVDGIVDKAWNAASNRTSSISRTEYHIRMLNNVLRKMDGPVYKTLSTNPEVPDDVRDIFLQIQSQGPPMNFGNN
jgi:hypothetical protein